MNLKAYKVMTLTLNISKERTTRNLNLLMTFFILGLKNVRHLVFIKRGLCFKRKP